MKHTIALLLLAFSHVSAEEWPEWRGPNGQGISSAKGLPETWSETSGVVWKAELPGRGHSTPVLTGNQLWLTTALEKAATPDQVKARLATNTGDQPLTVLDSVSLRVLCVDSISGKVLHDMEVLNVKNPQWAHQLNSYASPSPILENGRLYAHFGSLGTVCLDTATLKILWKNEELHVMHENGPGSTPVLSGNRLIAHFDGSDQQFIAAFDKTTGKVVWKTARSGKMDPRPQQRKAYGTPLIVTMNGQATIVSPAADWVYGYEPATGKELWKVETENFINSTPAVTPAGLALFGGCDAQMHVVSLKERKELRKLDAEAYVPASAAALGDMVYFGSDARKVFAFDAQTGTAAWTYRDRSFSYFSSPAISEEIVLIGGRDKRLHCLDRKTGEARWTFATRGDVDSSPVLCKDGAVVFGSMDGRLYCVESTTGNERWRYEVGSDIPSSPALAQGLIVIAAQDGSVYCIGSE